MQGPVSFADETLFMFLPHVRKQFVVTKKTFPTELAHRMDFEVEAFRFWWLSVELHRWQVVREQVQRISCVFVGEYFLLLNAKSTMSA